MIKNVPATYSPSNVNQVPLLAGMISIFIYMRSFLPIYRYENVTWYCFEFNSMGRRSGKISNIYRHHL